jgi:hypothetical protein
LRVPWVEKKYFTSFSLLLKRIWNEAEYMFMQSIVDLEFNDIVMIAGEESLIVMCISRYSLVKV